MIGSAHPNTGKQHYLSLTMVVAAMLVAGGGAGAQIPPAGGQVSIPSSSIEGSSDAGARAHTNIQIFVPNRHAAGMPPPSGGHHASTGQVVAPVVGVPGPRTGQQPVTDR